MDYTVLRLDGTPIGQAATPSMARELYRSSRGSHGRLLLLDKEGAPLTEAELDIMCAAGDEVATDIE